MIRRFSKILVALVTLMRISLPSAEGNAAAPETNATIWGIPFEEIEARWEGGIDASVLVTRGRLPGSDEIAHFERRMTLVDGEWDSVMHLDLPPSYVADLSGLFEHIPGLESFGGSGAIAFTTTITEIGEQRKMTGTFQFHDVSLTSEELDLSVEGLRGRFEWSYADGQLTSAPQQGLVFRSLRWDELETGKGELEFQMVSAQRWHLDRALLHWGGGRLAADDFFVNPTSPDVTLRLGAEGIQLGELLRLAPDFEGSGEGIIDGVLSLRIRPEGVSLQPGALALRAGHPARLQLPRRAWFTEGMPPEQSNFENLRMMERALENLELRRFRLDLLSAKDPDVPLQLTIEGRPLADDVPTPSVSFNLNVHGPIQELGSWVLRPGMSVEFQ